MATTNIVSGQTISDAIVGSGNEELVAAGGQAVGTTVEAGGTQYVLSGTAADTLVHAGGTLKVDHGEAQFTTVDSGGGVYVVSGGVVSNTTISLGGYQLVSASGFATNSLVKGVEQVVSGGTAVLCTVEDGGEQLVGAGGSTDYTLVSSGSVEQAIGGVASDTEIGAAGELLLAGGASVAASVLSGGVLYMDFGTASGTVISSGGVSLIGPGQSVGCFVLSGGLEFVAPGGEASSTAIETGGVQVIGPGSESLYAVASAGAVIVAFNQDGAQLAGEVLSATVMSGAEFIISGITPTGGFDFAAAKAIVLQAGALIDLAKDAYHAGATATLNAVTDQLTIAGVAHDGVLQLAGHYSGDSFVVFNDGNGGTEVGAVATANAPVTAAVKNGATTFNGSASITSVTSGQSVSNTLIGSGSQQLVEGGFTLSSVVQSAGEQILYTGSAEATLVEGGGSLSVSSGLALSATIASGGQAFAAGGTVQDMLIGTGGTLYTGNATIIGAIISGGYEYVSDDANAAENAIDSGSLIEAGGSQYLIYAGATAVDTIVASGGTEHVVFMAMATGTTIQAGGDAAFYSATGQNLVIDSGGYVVLSMGGVSDDTTISSGGMLIVLPGGSASGTVIDTPGAVVSTGLVRFAGSSLVSAGSATASGDVIGSGGKEYVLAGGFEISAVVENGGEVSVESGGVVSKTDFTFITSTFGYAETIYSGGLDLDATLGSEVIQNIEQGGTADGSIIGAGAQQLVFGTASGAVIAAGGTQNVEYTGSVTGTQIQAGGTLDLDGGTGFGIIVGSGAVLNNFDGGSGVTIDDGGVENDTGVSTRSFIQSGGVQNVEFAYGRANDAVIGSGGLQFVAGFTSGTVIRAGGIEEVVANAGRVGYSAEGGAAFGTTVLSGGELIVDTYPFSAGAIVQDTVLSAGGIIDLIGIEYQSGATAVLNATTDTLQIVQGGQDVYNLQLAGSYTGEYFTAFDDGSGNTDVAAVAAETTSVTSGQTVSGAVIGSGSKQIVDGGTAVATTIQTGGLQLLQAGAAIATDVQSGGMLLVSGGVASALVVGAAGSALVVGGLLSGAVISGGVLTDYTGIQGSLTIEAAGTATVATIQTATVADGGVLNATFGGTSVTVEAGGALFDSSESLGALTVESGGFAIAEAYAVISAARIQAGGTLVVLPGTESVTIAAAPGAAIISTGVVEASGASLIAAPTLYGGSAGSGSLVDVLSGGTASGLIVNDAPVTVYAGGILAAATLTGEAPYNSLKEIVSSGGVDRFTSIGVFVDQTVAGGASAFSETILSGGYQVVDGVATDVVVQSGGFQQVGGVAYGTTVMAGGSTGADGSGVISGAVLLGGGADATYGGRLAGTFIGSGGTIELYSAFSDDTEVGAGGEEFVGAAGTASGTIVSAGGVQIVKAEFGGFHNEGGVALNTTILGGGELVLQSSYLEGFGLASFTTIEVGGTINLADASFGGAPTTNFDSVTDMLTISGGGADVSLQLAGDYTGEYFTAFDVGSGGSGGTDVTVAEGTPCYCRGTRILTDRGEIAVEHLQIGDRLVTRSGAARPLIWIGTRSYQGRFAAGNPDVLPVLFRAGSLRANLPRRDLYVSPLHAMYLDGALVPAACLIDNRTIVQLDAIDRIDYFHLELDTHDVIFAEGALSETYVDDDNRGMFHNAAAYHASHPDAQVVPAHYCAPRVESGEALENIRRRLNPRPAARRVTLRGHLDIARHDCIAGWAADDGQAPVRLRIADNGVTLAEIVADLSRPDVQATDGGDGRCGFRHVIDGGLDPAIRHLLQITRAADGQALPGSPHALEIAGPAIAAAPLRGQLDEADRGQVQGWAYGDGEPVLLHVLDNGIPVGQVLANRYRADLVQAGIADGRCAFAYRFAAKLSPAIRHVIELRRAADGAALSNSPIVVEAATAFDEALQAAIEQAVTAADGADTTRVLHFLRAQADRLIQAQADAQSGRVARIQGREDSRRLGTAAPIFRRALVIDRDLPRPDHDAGSQAILSHMRALQRLGYEVNFVAAEQFCQSSPLLAAAGIAHFTAPLYTAVEDVLRRQQGCFDLVYLHRAPVAEAYMALVRRWVPRARVLYSVADLHHVRLARQAAAECRPELMAQSRRLRLAECTASWSADAVLTHSPAEADSLRAAVPTANVHVVPWDVAPRDGTIGFAKRDGLVFVGNYAHAPNLDAVQWLVREIMPLVWRQDPAIACRLIGAEMPAAVHALAGATVQVLGQCADVVGMIGRSRLSVAPLRYGAGIKGKVLESFAAGVPCACTPIAAEGLEVPGNLVAHDAAAFAALILRLHGNARANAAAARAGRLLLRRNNGADRVQAALGAAIERALRRVA